MRLAKSKKQVDNCLTCLKSPVKGGANLCSYASLWMCTAIHIEGSRIRAR
jgi:hypothetical protein